MPRIKLELPTIQNWSCHNCSGCCTQHGIYITQEEKARIESQTWTPADGIPVDQPLFVKMGGTFSKAWHRLAHKSDGGCVFLDEQGLCKIHGKFGEPAKPLACRIYPYAFHPAGNKVAVSLRFSCPSVADNLGVPVNDQRREIEEIARLVVPTNAHQAPPPEIRRGVTLDWPDTMQIVQRLDETFAAEAPVPVKLLRALCWIDLIDKTRFEKIQGTRLGELLDLIVQAASDEFPDALPDTDPPSAIGRTQFRLLAGQYARKDTYATGMGSVRGRLRMLRSALQLTSGRGTLPALQECLRPVPFEILETLFGGLPVQSEEMLTRYFRVKIQGMHFCGAAYYKIPLVEGLQSLTLVYAAVMWIARWLAAGDARAELTHQDVHTALTIADHHHGYSPAFGTWGFRRRVKNLVKMEDLQRLIVWYSR